VRATDVARPSKPQKGSPRMNTPLRDRQTTGTGREQLLAEAVRVLTEAARTTGDFAEFLTHAAAGAAANIGSIDALLAERPGSWEAHYVRDMLTATVGDDEQYLLEYRTEPLVVRVHVDDILNDLGLWALYDEDHEQITRREDAIHSRHDVDGDAQEYSADDQDALDELDRLHEALDTQRREDCAAYVDAFRDNVHRAAGELFPTLPVPVEVIVELDWQHDLGLRDDADGPAWRVWETARRTTPLPGSGIPLKDYPLMLNLAQVERDAGRTPLARLENSDSEAGDRR
jgi:hypothetical protein